MASFAAETIAFIGPFPITNTVIHTLIVDTILIGGTLYLKNRLSMIPSFFQNAVEAGMEAFYSLTTSIAQERAMKIFPYCMSFFVFIFIANITSLLPGFGTIGIYREGEHGKELVPLLRGATTDINTTFALALISLAATHIMSVSTLGIKEYLGRYLSLNPINLFVGLLEIVSEITKLVSLSFRLFGNIFAGEVTLATVSKLFAFLFPIPFLLLESVVSVVQALVFSALTLVFMAILTTPHHVESKEVNYS